eukprot:3415583-Rhodomonas_salina.3
MSNRKPGMARILHTPLSAIEAQSMLGDLSATRPHRNRDNCQSLMKNACIYSIKLVHPLARQ